MKEKNTLSMTIQVDFQYETERMTLDEAWEYAGRMVLEKARTVSHTVEEGIEVAGIRMIPEETADLPVKSADVDPEDKAVYEENKRMALEAIDELTRPGKVYKFIDGTYDKSSDTMSLYAGLGALSAFNDVAEMQFHMFVDLGYYKELIVFESSWAEEGGGAFDGNNDVVEPFEDAAFWNKAEPAILKAVLEACDKAGRVPTHINIISE